MSSKAKEAYERVVRGVEDLVRSDSWKEYLSFQSRFYDYSFNNTLLIWLQCPHASHVAGFRSWKKLGRFVKRGEKAIKILAPLTYKNELTDLSMKRKRSVNVLFGES